MAVPYRIYNAVYPFEARDPSELTIQPGNKLIVYQRAGVWPDDQRWMNGYNQQTGQQGDFPGTYSQFEQEVCPEPEPKPPPPVPDRTRKESQPKIKPRVIQRTISPEAENVVQSHDLFKVTLHLPVLCTVCEDYIWGARNTGHKCNFCGAVSHSSCREALMTIKCDPSDGGGAGGLEDSGRDYAYTVPSFVEFGESDVESWMKSLNIDIYWEHFRNGGITNGRALASVTMDTLMELGITDEVHQQIIMECLNELCRPTSSSLTTTDEIDIGRKGGKRPTSMISLESVSTKDNKKRERIVNGHVFKTHSYSTASKCDYCHKFLWGFIKQGLQCKTCSMKVHKMCIMDSIVSCDQWRNRGQKSEVFGLELATQFNCQVNKAPPIILKCVEVIEKKGIMLEGIYRISSSFSEIQKLKEEFNRDVEAINISDPRWTDAHVFAGVLKLYLRELPEPVFTYELYADFISSARSSKDNDMLYELLWPLVEKLPPHNRMTLEVILTHLNKVVGYHSKNRMSVSSLALVFGPTLVRPRLENVIELVSNCDAHCKIVEVLLLKGPWSQPATPPPPPVPRREKARTPIALPSNPPNLPNPRHSIGGGYPVPPSPAVRPPPPIPDPVEVTDYPENLTDCGWYWGNLSREDVTLKLKDTPDGTFLVRDSQHGSGEYTLTVRKGGQNKLIRIINFEGMYGFSAPGTFHSVVQLVNHFRENPLTKYNNRLTVKLEHPVSRYAKVVTDDDDMEGEPEEEDNDVEELLGKLREVTEMFDERNNNYLRLEASFEQMKKDLGKSQSAFNANNNIVEMYKEQLDVLKKWGDDSSFRLQQADQLKVVNTIKQLQEKHAEAVRALQMSSMETRKLNNSFRQLDRELNTIRPEMMRLQWQRDQYNSKLLQEGLTQTDIKYRVKAIETESESIYGTLYGTLDDDNDEQQGLYEDPNREPNEPRPPMPPPPQDTYVSPSSLVASAGPGPAIPPRRGNQPAPPRLRSSVSPGVDLEARHSITQSMPPQIGPRRDRRQMVQASMEERPHNRQGTWYVECDRNESQRMLRGKRNGTFLCRPSGRAQQNLKGGLHTHTIDIVYDGIKHLKVVQHENKYGFSVPCQYQSLLDLILSYSEISLETHNPKLTTHLAYPINAT